MTVMYSFCLWFPVRLGAIIVAVTCACESIACLIAAIVGFSDLGKTSATIDDWLGKNDLKAATGFFESMEDGKIFNLWGERQWLDFLKDPYNYLVGFISALSIHLFTCTLLIFGAFWCNLWLIYPFIVIDFLRLVLLSTILGILLLIIKANTLTLGAVIGCSICGGFILLYFWYQWFCVVSLCQILREVKRMDRNQITPINYPNPVIKKDLSLHPSYASHPTYHRKFSALPKLTY